MYNAIVQLKEVAVYFAIPWRHASPPDHVVRNLTAGLLDTKDSVGIVENMALDFTPYSAPGVK